MKNKYFIYSLFFTICSISFTYAQVGVDNTDPKGLLHISSSTGGLVYPSVALVDENTQTIINPNGGNIVAGTTVYNSTASGTGSDRVYPGLYIWNGTQWIPQFNKKDNHLFTQSADLRTGYNEGAQSISFTGNSFTALYNGPYRIEVTVHFGGGRLDSPNNTNQFTNYSAQDGQFDFTFNSTSHTFSLGAYSGNNDDQLFAGTNFYEYYNKFVQMQYVLEEDLTAGNTYNFTLTFDQTLSNGFISDGNIATNGSGYIIFNNGIRCKVEINYMGD